MTPLLGWIINPVAGLGGRVGLKGSDGTEIQALARRLGARPHSEARALEALSRLAPLRGGLTILAYPGEMGAAAAAAGGFRTEVIGEITPGATTALDTQSAAAEMRRGGADLILFAGGDGTARDLAQAIGETIPTLGIPAGVKILSAAFAIHPAAAGDLARDYLEGRVHRLRPAEVLDLDEDGYRAGRVSPRLFGSLIVPEASRLLQRRKSASGPDEHGRLLSIAREIVEQMDDRTAYVIGPGTTTRPILTLLGLEKTLVGVDVVFQRRMLVRDGAEADLLRLVEQHPVRIVVTPIGGQGYLFGRGNAQISPAVLRAAGRRSILVVSTPEKIHGLQGRPFLVDSGDAELDQELCGYLRVITGYNERIIYRVAV